MAEFVKKTMMGYKEVPGGQSDPECTYVILKEKEYSQLLKEKAQAEQESWNTRHDADRAIQRAKSEAQRQIQQIDAEAQQRVSDMEEELATAQKEAEYQRGLNANLLRISKERANADRKLKPKKEHTGFVVVTVGEKEHRYKDGNRHWRSAMLRETILQSPFSTDFTEEQARKQIFEALFKPDEGGGWLIGKIGITAYYPNGYAELMDNREWDEVREKRNIAVDLHLKANFRAGYWELIVLHTKPLGQVPVDMRIR